MKKINGFTLVELMIAVVVIGILISIAIPNYAHSIERSKCAQARHILKNMRTAALAVYANTESFTDISDVSDLETAVAGNFYSDGSNQDWTFSVANVTNSTITVRASRTSGPHNATRPLMTLDQDDNWNDPAAAGFYPWNNAGHF